jgi:hypothetical protein
MVVEPNWMEDDTIRRLLVERMQPPPWPGCCSLKCRLTPRRRDEMALSVIEARVAEQWCVPEDRGALGRAL